VQAAQYTKITSATTTDIVATPASGKVRNVKQLEIRNKHASTSNAVTVLKDVNGTDYEKFKCTLLAQEVLVCREGVWFHYDANGAVYSTGLPFAVQADMETGTSLTLAVSPGMIGFHPSSVKCWGLFSITGTVTASYNITSVTDTGTGVITVTIATDFSSANWAALATIELTSTTVAQSCTTDSRAAGSVVLRSVVEAGSSADPVSWAFAGLGDQ
jgi:hypothetical protein